MKKWKKIVLLVIANILTILLAMAVSFIMLLMDVYDQKLIAFTKIANHVLLYLTIFLGFFSVLIKSWKFALGALAAPLCTLIIFTFLTVYFVHTATITRDLTTPTGEKVTMKIEPCYQPDDPLPCFGSGATYLTEQEGIRIWALGSTEHTPRFGLWRNNTRDLYIMSFHFENQQETEVEYEYFENQIPSLFNEEVPVSRFP